MGKSDQCKKAEAMKKGAEKKVEKAKQPPKSGASDQPVLEFPHTLRIIGPKHIKILLGFIPSALIYGVTSLLFVTYVADWKTVLQYLPYYNGKYYVEQQTSAKPENENIETPADGKEENDQTETQNAENETGDNLQETDVQQEPEKNEQTN